MNHNQDPFDLDKKIQHIVNDAVNSADLQELDKKIKHTVNDAINSKDVQKFKSEVTNTFKSILNIGASPTKPNPAPGSPVPPLNEPYSNGNNPYRDPRTSTSYSKQTPYSQNNSSNPYQNPNTNIPPPNPNPPPPPPNPKAAYTPPRGSPYWNPKQTGDGSYANPHSSGYSPNDNPQYVPDKKNYDPQPVQKRKRIPKTSVAGVLMIVFGIIGEIGYGLGAIALAVSSMVTGSDINATAGLAVLMALCLAFAGVIKHGFTLCGRVKRYKRYLQEIGTSQMCPVEALASAVGRSKKFVVKDLLKMIRSGMFPDGYLDSKKTTLILDSQTYRQYLKAEEKMRELQKQGKEKLPKTTPSTENAPSTGNPELDSALADGRKYISKIKFANDMIPEEDISNKIDHLEQVCVKIFDYVAEHPKKLPDIRRFMNYYLPTTLKLLDAYCQFDAQPIQGENITLAKKEIHETLDTINAAFENLLDNLFKDIALDISTDISAMEAMMAQEGLTDSDFKKSSDNDKWDL